VSTPQTLVAARDAATAGRQICAVAIFEIIQQDVAAGATAQLPRRLPQLAYLATSPFPGQQEAIERLGGKVGSWPGGRLADAMRYGRVLTLAALSP